MGAHISPCVQCTCNSCTRSKAKRLIAAKEIAAVTSFRVIIRLGMPWMEEASRKPQGKGSEKKGGAKRCTKKPLCCKWVMHTCVYGPIIRTWMFWVQLWVQVVPYDRKKSFCAQSPLEKLVCPFLRAKNPKRFTPFFHVFFTRGRPNQILRGSKLDAKRFFFLFFSCMRREIGVGARHGYKKKDIILWRQKIRSPVRISRRHVRTFGVIARVCVRYLRQPNSPFLSVRRGSCVMMMWP